jgi:hypothetical protein
MPQPMPEWPPRRMNIIASGRPTRTMKKRVLPLMSVSFSCRGSATPAATLVELKMERRREEPVQLICWFCAFDAGQCPAADVDEACVGDG